MQTELMKVANLGGTGGETEFEQAFSSLAYAYLRDKAPRLLDYMVGFQLVERNEDNTKAVGVFGFQIDTQWLYAPVFFLNGDLKGHELLYIKNNDSFVPLKENWINYIMSRKPHILGEQAGVSKLRELGGIYPDIRTFSIPPSIGGGKRASDSSWVRGVLPMLAAFKTKTAGSLYKGAGTRKLNQAAVVAEPFAAALAKQAQNLDLNTVMPTSLSLLKAAHALAERFPAVQHGLRRFYGADCLSRWGNQLKSAAEVQIANIMPEKQAEAKPFMPGSLIIPTERPAAPVDHVKEGKLRMYVAEYVIDNRMPELDDAERAKLLNDTVLIKDHRKGEQVSRVYNTQVEAKLTNPSETALYRVLEKPGTFNKSLISTNPISNRGREPMATVVRLENNNGSGKAWINTYTTNVFADQISERDEWDAWFESLGNSQTLGEGGEYIGVTEDGSTTTPFHVSEVRGDGQYVVDFRTHVNFDERRPSTTYHTQKLTDPWTDNDYYIPSPHGAILTVNAEGKRGTQMRAIAGELRVPASTKFIKLRDAHTAGGGLLMSCCGESRSEPAPIRLGKIDDIQLLFYEKTASLKLHNNRTDVYIESALGNERLSQRDALWNLVSVHGLTEKAARDILAYSEKKGSASYRIQYAKGYGTEKLAAPNRSILAGGPSAPIYEDFADERSVEQYGPRTAVPTQYAGAAAYRLPELTAEQTDPSVWDPWMNYEASDFIKTVQTAQQASQSGQKEVFDTAMISGMIKSVRQDSIVERHLSDLVDALDALGRLLMNFYWHNEEFSDRYGKADMPELEDSLRNAFESLGDVTLFLKEKTIESPFGQGDISLEETARN